MVRLRYLDDDSVFDTEQPAPLTKPQVAQSSQRPRLRYLDDNSVVEPDPIFSEQEYDAQYNNQFAQTEPAKKPVRPKPISDPRVLLEQQAQQNAAKLRGEVTESKPTHEDLKTQQYAKHYGDRAGEFAPLVDLLVEDFPAYSKRIDAEVKKGRTPDQIRKIIMAEEETKAAKLKTKQTVSGPQVDAQPKVDEFLDKYERETDPARKEKLRTIIKRLGAITQSEGDRGVQDVQRQELVEQGENIYSALKGPGSNVGVNLILNPQEKYWLGEKFEPSTTTGKAILTGTQLAGGIATGQGVASGVGRLLAKTALSKGAKTALTSAATAALQTGVNSAVEAATGDYPKTEALKDIVQNVSAAMVSLGISKTVPRGTLNAVAQVAGDFLYDLGTDAFFRDRLKDQSFKDWFINYELPQLITSGTFAVKGLRDNAAIKQRVLNDASEQGVVQRLEDSSENIPTAGTDYEPTTLPRKFLTRATQETDAPPAVVKALESIEPQTYEVHKTSKELNEVKDWLKAGAGNTTKAEEVVYSNDPPSARKAVMGVALLDKYRKDGNVDAEVKLTEHLDRQFRESGRFIQAASFWSSMTGAAQKRAFRNFIKDRKLALSRDVLKDIDSRFDEAARKSGKEREQAVAEAITYATQYVPVRFGDKWDAYRYTNMLSNPRSHERNIVGNLFNAAVTRTGSLVGQGDIKGAGKYLKGAGQSIGDAYIAAKDAWSKSATSKLIETGATGKSAFDTAMQQKLPKSLRVVGRALEAQDRFFSTLIEAGEKNRLLSKGVDPKVADKQARQISEKYLYRDPLGVGMRDSSLNVFSRALDGLGYGVDKMRNLPGIGPVMRPFLPFIKTPINIAKSGIEASPMALAGKPMTRNNIAKARHGTSFDKLTPEQKASVSSELRERQGLAAMGSFVMAASGLMAAEGRTTWAAPKDEKAKELFYASGRKPFSILVGDKWIPMWTFGTLGIALGIPAAVRDVYYDNPETVNAGMDEKMLALAGGLSRLIASQTPVEFVSSFFNTISGNEDSSLGRTAGFMATQLIPASGLIRYVNQWVDPYFRKPKNVAETLMRDIPGLSSGIEPYTTPEGEPAKRTLLDKLPPFSVGKRNDKYEAAYKDRVASLKQREANNEESDQLARLVQKGAIEQEELLNFLNSKPNRERQRLILRLRDRFDLAI